MDSSLMQCELFDGPEHDTHSGKTSQGLSALTPAQTLRQYLEKWLGYALTYRTVDGETPEFCSGQPDWSSGPYWMRNGSEFRSGAVASSLSEILETGPIDRRYFLTPKACRGILRRAEKRGKTLPEALHRALLAVADSERTSILRGGYELSPALTGSGRGTDRAGDSRGQDCVIPILADTLTGGSDTGKNHGKRSGSDRDTLIPFHTTGDGYWQPGAGTLHAVCFDTTQITSVANRSNPQPGDPCHPLPAGADAPLLIASTGDTSHCLNAGGMGRIDYETETLIVVALGRQHTPNGHGQSGVNLQTAAAGHILPVAFSCKDSGADAGETAPTLRAMEFDGSHANGGGQVAIAFETRFVRNGRDAPDTVVPPLKAQSGETGKGDAAPCVATGSAVRRLLPVECERLQGFSDGHTDIGRADGPRYKALGNSMAVPVIAWIGKRLAQHWPEGVPRR